MLLDGRPREFIVPLDIELCARGYLLALARCGSAARRSAVENRLIARLFLVVLRTNDGEFRLFLSTLSLRLRRLCVGDFFRRGRCFRFGLRLLLLRFQLLLFLLLHARLLALLPLQSQRIFPFQFFLLLRVAQCAFFLPALLPFHAQVIQQFGQPHAQPAEGNAGHCHQHDCRRTNHHNHAAPDVQRLMQRPRKQRTNQSAALAFQRRHGERPRQKRAIAHARAIRCQSRVDVGKIKQLEHRFHKQENQRAVNQRPRIQLLFSEKHERYARPAQDDRQQQAEYAAQTAHGQHAAVQKSAVRRNELTDQCQQSQTEYGDSNDAARVCALLLFAASRSSALSGDRAFFLCRALCCLLRHLLPSNLYKNLQLGCRPNLPESISILKPRFSAQTRFNRRMHRILL